MGDSYNNVLQGGSPWPVTDGNDGRNEDMVEDLNESWAENVNLSDYKGDFSHIGTPKTLNFPVPTSEPVSKGFAVQANGSTRRYHENSNGFSRPSFPEEKLAAKEDADEGIDAAMIKEEVYDVLEAIDYHQGVMWGDNGQKVIRAAAKAREEEQLRLQQGNRGNKYSPISDDLRAILVAAKARGVNLKKWFGHFDVRRTGRISSGDLQKAISGLGLGLSIGASDVQGGVEYGSSSRSGIEVAEDVVERVLNPTAMSKLVARLNDGKGEGVEGTSVPYATLVACGNRQVTSNRFDRLVQSGKSLPPSSKKNKKLRPVTPSQAQAQAKARVRARIRSDVQRAKKKSTKKGTTKKNSPPPRAPQVRVARRPKRGKSNVTETGAILVPGETGLNVQVAIQTMQRITNKSIAKREAKEKARQLKLLDDESTFEDRLVKLIQAPGPFHAILKEVEQKQKAGKTVTRKYVTCTLFESIIRKLFHLRISDEDSILILQRATEATMDTNNVEGGEEDFVSIMSPREKRLVEEHGKSIALSTKRMLKYLRRLRCRKRMDFVDWFDRKQIKVETSEKTNKELLLNGANGDTGALRRLLSSANQLEQDALISLGELGIKKSAPKIKGHVVRAAVSKDELVVAMKSVQTQLLVEGTVKDEADIMAGEWVLSNDGRSKVLCMAREMAGIGPRFSTSSSPSSKRSKSKSIQEELYPEPPQEAIKSASASLKAEKVEELLSDANFHTTIFRMLFGEYVRNIVISGSGCSNFEEFQNWRKTRHRTLKTEINNWQRKKAKVQLKKKSADTRFADVNETILFVQDLVLNSSREFSNMTMKYNSLRELGARRQLLDNKGGKRNPPSESSLQDANDIYSNTVLASSTKRNVIPKVGTISMKEFLDVMEPVFFSLQADPKTALVAGVVIDGLEETVDKSYNSLIATEVGTVKLKELGAENLKRMQDKFVKENSAVQEYIKLFAPDTSGKEKAMSAALVNLNRKEAAAEEKFNEWLRKKKEAQSATLKRQKKLLKKKEKKQQRTVTARSNKIKEFNKRIKNRKKKMSKSKSKPLSSRPSWSNAWKGTKEGTEESSFNES